MNDRLNDITVRIKEIQDTLSKISSQITQLRKIVFFKKASTEDREALRLMEGRSKELIDESEMLSKEMQQILGIPDEMIDVIEKERIGGDTFDTLPRKNIAYEKVAPTNIIEKELPNSIESLLRIVDTKWLNGERTKKYRLDDNFLAEPLSIIRGVRIESETLPIHRFAQTIFIAEDCLHGNSGFDFFAGALLVPQLIALGSRLSELKYVSGGLQDQLTALWKGDSDRIDSLIYELLVASSCVRAGRKTEFLLPTSQSSPDLRIHDYPFPLVVECKRQQKLTDYEFREETIMRNLFTVLYTEARKLGLRGRFHLILDIEADQMSISDIVSVALRQRLTPEPAKLLKYNWGAIAFYELPYRVEGPLTKLYSPTLLHQVFDWNFDMPEYDGIICKVERPDSIFVDYVENPVALLWTNNSPAATLKRARSAISLFAGATKQIPAGEMGIIYICYQEGARENIADDRTKYFIEEIKKWGHDTSIRIPAFFLTRLVPRPLRDGFPDLIETGFRFLSGLYGDQSLFIDFPTTVFTKN